MPFLSKPIRILFLLAFFLGAISCTGFAEEDKVNWDSYESGMEKIKTEEKMGFLHFYTDWCTYCKLMVKQTFADPKVADYLNAHFISIKVNAEKEKDIAKKYNAYRFPSNWFLSKKGETVANRPGFIPPDQMITMLKYMHTGSYQEMNFQEFVDRQK